MTEFFQSLGMSYEWAWFVATVSGILLIAFPVMLAVAMIIYMDRKVLGAVMMRRGPNVVGPFGLLQSFADGLKVFLQETIIPSAANKGIFLLAPIVTFTVALAAWAVIPFDAHMVLADINVGLLYILAISSLGVYGVVMAGWASNSKWSLYGAMREAAQVVAYEIPLGLSLLAPLFALGTFSLGEASALQSGWFGMKWAIFTNPFLVPAFLIYAIAALAETKRAPFDLPEAESELVAGFMTEYSGIRWSFFFFEEYAAMLLMSIVGAFFWFGGFESPVTGALRAAGVEESSLLFGFVCFGTVMLKGLFGIFLMMWLRWTLPRVRIDQVMTMGYKYLTPLALFCVLGAACWEALVHALFS